MKREVFLFVSRNMGSGFANAYPKCSRLFSWWCESVLLPRAQADFVRAIEARSAVRTTADGVRRIEHISSVFNRYVCSMRVVPDTRCTDPAAKGRSPKFDMQIVFDGKPDLFCKAFDDCLAECRKRGWDAMEPGESETLRFLAPSEMYPDKR